MIDFIKPGTPLWQQQQSPTGSLRWVHAVEVLDSGNVFVRRGGMTWHNEGTGNFAIAPPKRLSIECPVCDGDCTMYDDRHEITCPACNGDGHISLHDLSPQPPAYYGFQGGDIRPSGAAYGVNEGLEFAISRLKLKYAHLNLEEEARAERADREFDEDR